MERSQYLAQALQALGQGPAPAARGGMSLQQMAQMGDQAKAWKAKNPGKSYIGSRFTQAIQNVASAPGRMMDGGMGQQQPMQAPQSMQPQAPAGFIQPSVLQNGNAEPEFIVPEWARDGTPADHPGARTYFDMSKIGTPYSPQPASAGRGKGVAAQPSDPTAALGAAGVVAKKAPGGMVAEALKSFLKG